MEILFLLIVLILLIVSWASKKTKQKKPKGVKRERYNASGFDHNGIHRNGTKFDDAGFDCNGYNAEGFDRNGYNRKGKNAKGQYNRLFDPSSCAEEGFLDPRIHPVALTDHACFRLQERLHIYDKREMLKAAQKAYCFGKSKRQIKKTSAYLVEELEQRHENGIILIYNSYIYVFLKSNALKTVFKNEKIPL